MRRNGRVGLRLRRRSASTAPSAPGQERTPWLVLVPALLAPLVLAGGWNLAASAQTDEYDGFRDTLSALAAYGATHREIMTWTFVVLGLCHLATAALLRVVGRRGRLTHALGGAATVAVALLPLGAERDTARHAVAATVAFVALALWPALGARRDGPRVLRPRTMQAASAVLGLLVLAFGVTLLTGTIVGLVERVAALAEALAPLVVAWLVRESDGGGGDPPVERPTAPPAPIDKRPNDGRPAGPADPGSDLPVDGRSAETLRR